MCHALLHNPKFFSLLVQIDAHAAEQIHGTVCCLCGAGVLHQANYPRKPRACPEEVLWKFQLRWSFCCNLCRLRTTPMSVRFFGRRVYVALAVVLLPQRRSTLSAAAIEIGDTLNVPPRTLARWRQWWREIFPATTVWQAHSALLMPPVQSAELPAGLIARFTGATHEAMVRLLVFVSPLSVHT